MATKKATKRSTAKRELIQPNGDKRLVRRNTKGQIKESDDLSLSLSKDVKQSAKKTVGAGQGDKGDRRRS